MFRLGRRQTFVYRAFDIAGRNFVLNDCTTISASISYVFLLAVIPFSALFLFIFSIFQRTLLHGLFPENMVAIMVENINQLIPFVSKAWVQTHLVDSVGLGSFTTINLMMLPIISGLLFKSLDQAYRKIFNLPKRSLLTGQAAYALMSIFAIVFFFMLNFIWTLVSDTTWQFQLSIEPAAYLGDLYQSALDFFSLSQNNVVSWLILMLFFVTSARIFLPTDIKLRHRLMAGGLFGLLWLFARAGFGIYIQNVASINVLFGSLGSVCIILLWIFYSSVALLYSVEFLYALHCGPYKTWDWEATSGSIYKGRRAR